jgi:hypothetical protein
MTHTEKNSDLSQATDILYVVSTTPRHERIRTRNVSDEKHLRLDVFDAALINFRRQFTIKTKGSSFTDLMVK